jgi:hypothetical protein
MMSKIIYNSKVQTNQVLFSDALVDNGALCNRHGISMGGTWAYGLLGPDLMMPGGGTLNPPSAGCVGWNLPWTGPGRPAVTFVEDGGVSWKRGHLINGEWGGSGSNWNNLTPLTATANVNHKTVEQFIKNYLIASYAHDCSASSGTVIPDWYGVQYMVECSTDPWADNTNDVPTQLYAYAPAFIRVSWRAVRIAKPTTVPPSSIPAVIRTLPQNPVQPLPFPVIRPAVMIGVQCLPSGTNVPGGTVYVCPHMLVALQANNFDGQIEIHQD